MIASALRIVAGGPLRLMLVAWGASLLLFFVGPVQFTDTLSPAFWWFCGASGLAFALGTCIRFRAAPPQPLANERLRSLTSAFAAAGLTGIAALAVEKIFVAGLDFSQGLAALRAFQDGDVLSTGFTQHGRSLLLYIGYLLFPFGIVSFLIGLLEGERLGGRTRFLALSGLAAPVGFAVLYAGRSPLYLALAYGFGAIALRAMRRQLLPAGVVTWVGAIIFVLGTATYTVKVFLDRAQVRNHDVEQIVENFDAFTLARASPFVASKVASGQVAAETAFATMYTAYYFTHGFVVLDRALQYRGPLGPYWGQHNFYILSALLDQGAPSLSYATAIRVEAQNADIYGWFLTALGSMYLDFGYLPSLLATMLLGVLSRRSWDRARVSGNLSADLVVCFAIGSICVSPTMSPFTVSIALQVLFGVLVAAIVFARSAKVSPAGSAELTTTTPIP